MYKRLAILVVAAAALLQQGGTAHAEQRLQSRRLGPQRGTSASTSNSGDLPLQRERLEFDRQKLASDADIENKKLEIERDKLHIEKSTSRWSALAAIGPVTIALGALFFSIWSFLRQGEQQSKMQLQAARLEFEIKAAEIAFSGKTPRAVANRAKALKGIFPDRLPVDFAKDFSPMDVGGNKEPSEEKMLCLELLLKYPDKQADVVDLWEKLFPGDKEWLDRVKKPR